MNVSFRIKNSCQARVAVARRPNAPMVIFNDEPVGNPPGLLVFAIHRCREKEPADNPEALERRKPVVRHNLQDSHDGLDYTRLPAA